MLPKGALKGNVELTTATMQALENREIMAQKLKQIKL